MSSILLIFLFFYIVISYVVPYITLHLKNYLEKVKRIDNDI